MVQPPPFGGKPGSSGQGRRSLLDVDESEMWAPDAVESAADDFAARFEQATADLDELSLADLSEPDGGDARPEPEAPADAAELETPEERARREAEAAASMAAKAASEPELQADLSPDASGVGADAFSAPEDVGGGELQLDFAAAGMARPSAAAPQPAARSAAPPSPPSASMSGAAASTAMVPSPGISMVGPVSPAPAHPEHDSLLGVDRISAGLIGLAIGLVVGLFPATSVSRSMIEESTVDLFAELEEAVDRPLAVRAGDVRKPSAIADEIRAAYGPAQTRFYMIWLGVALPFGVASALLRRRR